jgi:hypothetical protein
VEAPSNITCPDCRARWQRYHDEQGRAVVHSPVGYVKLYTADAIQPLICRSYADIRARILPLADGETFRLELVAFMATVGTGCYTRFGAGVAVSCEDGAAKGLSIAMRPAIPVESSTLQLP